MKCDGWVPAHHAGLEIKVPLVDMEYTKVSPSNETFNKHSNT